MFEPRKGSGGSPQRYCSKAHTDRASNIRRMADGRQALSDARWYARGGQLKQYRAYLKRRMAAKRQRLETL